MDHECPKCGETYKRYSTTQTVCSNCYFRRTASKPLKPRKPLARTQKPLRRSAKPIKQYGKHAKQWATFRDKVARPYLDTKYGRVCSVDGCSESQFLDVDHIKPRGSHPELRYDVTNLRYLCRPHHIERTGTVHWTIPD